MIAGPQRIVDETNGTSARQGSARKVSKHQKADGDLTPQKLRGLSLWLTMQDPDLLLYQSPKLVSDSDGYIDYKRKASTLGAKRIYHYHAISNAVKGMENHIALPDFVISEDFQSEEPPDSPNSTVRTTQPIPISSPPSTELVGDSSPPSSLLKLIRDARSGRLEPARAMEDDFPQVEAKDLLPWSDDDVDGTDYKNMPDYDPWQEGSTYESTPEPEITAEPIKGISLADRSSVRRYIMLDRKQNSERNKSAEETSGRHTP